MVLTATEPMGGSLILWGCTVSAQSIKRGGTDETHAFAMMGACWLKVVGGGGGTGGGDVCAANRNACARVAGKQMG